MDELFWREGLNFDPQSDRQVILIHARNDTERDTVDGAIKANRIVYDADCYRFTAGPESR